MISVLIAPNSFKGCIDSIDITDHIYNNLFNENPKFKHKIDILKRPISDGGDGFLNICKTYFNLTIQMIEVEYLDCGYQLIPIGIDFQNRKVYVEIATMIGSNGLSTDNSKLNPYIYNSAPVGQLLNKLNLLNKKNNCFDKVIIGIGGTITSDLGLGIMYAFGLLMKRHNKVLPLRPSEFINATDIEYSKPNLTFTIDIVTDVTNPLLGKHGANYCFGEQKGIKKEDIELFEKGFENVLHLLRINDLQIYNGAGGGVAFALQYFLDAKVITSKDFILNILNINEIEPDYVITGEGSFDKQSLLNKGSKVIIDYAQNKNVKKIFVISGKNTEINNDKLIIHCVQNYFKTQAESISNVKEGLNIITKIISSEIIKDCNGK